MKTRLSPGSLLGIALSMAILVLICAPVHAQWAKAPERAIPRAPDGKPNLSAPAPRLPDGHPDLSGIWEPNGNRYEEVHLLTNTELLEFTCNENNLDVKHLPGHPGK